MVVDILDDCIHSFRKFCIPANHIRRLKKILLHILLVFLFSKVREFVYYLYSF